MTYRKNLVVCIKVNGKILREQGDTVELPFGSEYSIFLKNLEPVRSIAKIQIDGKDINDGQGFIVPANGKIEIERFIRNGNLKSGNRFKFIQRTQEIEKHRGIEACDSLIRVEFAKEKRQQPIAYRQTEVHHHHYNYDYWCPACWRVPATLYPTYTDYTTYTSCGLFQGVQNSSAGRGSTSCNVAQTETKAVYDKGITVPGSQSNQEFVNVTSFETEEPEVIVLQLIGKVGESQVSRPVTVDIKPTCITCGKTNKATSKYCSQCGTALELI